LEYLLRRTSDKQTDILRTILMDFYTEAITTDTPDKFQEAYRKFEEIRRHFRGTIRDHIEEEVAEMSNSIEQRAEELGIPVSLRSIDDFTAKDLVDTLPLIVMEYKSSHGNPSEAAKNLRLPESSIQTFWNIFNTIRVQKTVERGVVDQGVVWGAGVGYPSLELFYSRVMPKPKEFTVVYSTLGWLLSKRISKEYGESYIECPEDASAELYLRHALPTDSADSFVIECIERRSM